MPPQQVNSPPPIQNQGTPTPPPMLHTWNKFAIATVILFVVAWVGGNFINHVAWLVAQPLYQASPGISGLLEMLGVISPHIIVVILAIIAIRKIKVTGEKGKILSWIILVLAILTILLLTTTMFVANNNVRELFTGDPSSQYTSGLTDVEEEVSRMQGRDTRKYADMKLIQNFLQQLHGTDGRYPLDSTELNAKATNLPWKDWDVTYVSIDNGKSYVLRTQLESDYLDRLNETDDKDGMQGSLDCSDTSHYLCYTP